MKQKARHPALLEQRRAFLMKDDPKRMFLLIWAKGVGHMDVWLLILKYACCVLAGYFVGTFNPSYLLARIKGYDIRSKGSGNAGASNALILFGKLRGAICALLDISKAFLVVFIMQRVFPELPLVYAFTAAACILGHIFPFYMGFKGGKGLACLAGVILCYDWRYFLIALVIEIAIALLTDYICFIPLTASIGFTLSYLIMRQDVWGTLIILVAASAIFFRHMENLKRIKAGSELRLSFLWNRKKEIERLRKNTGKSEKDYFIDEE
ncbi:MAG: glycerol-3-phosphate acyltransferase [Ruminococcaceae bacterium]|nr:glycerol-3-phosphate acyltransferase [Oscillospiraceae bacterium]